MLLVWCQFDTLRHKMLKLQYTWADTCVIENGFMKKGQKCLKNDHRGGLNLGKMCALVSLSFSCPLHSNLPSDFHKFSAHFPALFQTSQTLQGTFLTILFWDLVCLSHSWSCIKTMHKAHLFRCLWQYNGVFSKVHHNSIGLRVLYIFHFTQKW